MAAGAALVVALAAQGTQTAAAQTITCEQPLPFAPASFTNPTTINNQMLPLVPGVQTVLEGTVNRGNQALSHSVTFTVTDVTKTVGGVRSVVVQDIDRNLGQVIESELSFWAQDDAGNVWNIGEYPEEYQDGTLLGAPFTWIAGLANAVPGIHMLATPTVSKAFYLQGQQLDIQFEDCAHVIKTGQQTPTPVGTFDNVLVTEETSPLDPAGGSQLKFHAPGVGIVRVEPVNDPEGELLELTARRTLSPDELAAVRQQVLDQDQRGYGLSDVYAQTPAAEPPPPPPPPPPPVVAKPASTKLTKASARRVLRAALRRHLRRWRITGTACRPRSDARVTCTFSATKRGARLKGNGVIRRDASGAVRYRLTARITKAGCRPASSRRCTRTRRWSR